MSAIAFHKVTKILGGVPVLEDASFEVQKGTKVGLIGQNGSGKSTVLRLIEGTLQPESGQVSLSKSEYAAYLPQIPDVDTELNAFEEAMSARPHLSEMRGKMRSLEAGLGGPASQDQARQMAYAHAVSQFYELGGDILERDARDALLKLGLTEEQLTLPMSCLSGGEKARVALAKVLLTGASLLILDEPDNHLDIDGILWLEDMLRQFRGTLLLVTHDRELLDAVVDTIVEIEGGKTASQKGNCTEFLDLKRERLERQMQQYLEQQIRVRKLKAAVHRASCKALKIEHETTDFHYRKRALKVARRAVTLKRRIQRELEGEKRVEKPDTTEDRIKVQVAPRRSDSKSVLHLSGLSKSFGERVLFKGVELSLSRGQRIALVGPNGGGKTTLMEIALGIQQADEGEVWLSKGASIFYCDQELAGLKPDLTVYETLAKETNLTHNQIHYLLAKLLFRQEAVHKQVSHLSGGERSRLVLALLVNSQADVLMLDEPTNHLDLMGIEVLQRALADFAGALLFITHNRRLVAEVANEMVRLHDGRLEMDAAWLR